MQPHPLIHAELARQRPLDLRASAGRADQADLGPVVSAARAGDQTAWASLVARFTPLMRHVVREYRLSTADAEDVVQTAWTSAFSGIGRLREAEAIGGWLCVIARREAVRTISRQRREVPVDNAGVVDRKDSSTPETVVLEAEGRHILHAAIDRLPRRQRELVRALLQDEGGSYAEVSRKLSVPVGSIGPTRERALARLRGDRQLVALR